MLLGTVARAKSAGTATVCRNNLRQLILGTQLYVGDHAVYPAYLSVDRTERLFFWSQALEDYVKSSWPATDLPGHALTGGTDRKPRGVFSCPGYDRLPGYYLHPQTTRTPLGSYAYNRAGMSAAGRGPALGVGGRIRSRTPRTAADVTHAREESVASPANLFVLADAVFVPRTDSGVVRYAGADDFSPFTLPWLAMELGIRTPNPTWEGARVATKRRHELRFNIALADGHVEMLPVKKIFSATDEVLKRWNIDNQPHRELIPTFR